MRALVTGAGGFVGQWLCRALLREGWTVDGLSLEGEPSGGILTASERAAVRWTALDLSTRPDEPIQLRPSVRAPQSETERRLADAIAVPTDAVFHLSGIALQSAAAQDVKRAESVNVGGLQLLLQAVHREQAAGRSGPTILVIGSGEQYGRHDVSALPLPEVAPCHPLTPYGQSKVEQEELAQYWHGASEVRIICTRSFNHSGPGQSPKFFLPGLVARVKAAPPHGEIPIGNTDVIRDFLHVEDVVAAYISLVARGTPGEVYNVCSGDGVRIGDLAAEVLAVAGSTASLKVDPALQRAVDVPALVGSNAKLRAATGWAPKKSRSDIITDLLNAAS